MKIVINDLLYALSDALDCVEEQLVGVSTYHAKRVAYLAVATGRTLKLTENQQVDLAAAAVLHDNALTEYIQEEIQNGIDIITQKSKINLGTHCLLGETNIGEMPMYDRVKNAILYHHEQPDRNGPFKKSTVETPIFAQLIHLADQIDAIFDLNVITNDKYNNIINFLNQNIGILFDEKVVNSFCESFSSQKLKRITNNNINNELHKILPSVEQEINGEELTKISNVFSKIIDYKSSYTSHHSIGVATKAHKMAKFYNWSVEIQNEIYFSAALHDIGKLMVDNDILEKPDKLTSDEYKSIQNHAMGTYNILNNIKGLGDIVFWSSYHHEKLDGSGYPFGKKADQLGKKERLMACLDIYQALIEPRPYKNELHHKEAMKILRKMAKNNKIDSQIVEDIDECFKIY